MRKALRAGVGWALVLGPMALACVGMAFYPLWTIAGTVAFLSVICVAGSVQEAKGSNLRRWGSGTFKGVAMVAAVVGVLGAAAILSGVLGDADEPGIHVTSRAWR